MTGDDLALRSVSGGWRGLPPPTPLEHLLPVAPPRARRLEHLVGDAAGGLRDDGGDAGGGAEGGGSQRVVDQRVNREHQRHQWHGDTGEPLQPALVARGEMGAWGRWTGGGIMW